MKECILGYKVYALRVDLCVDEIFASVLSGEDKAWLACLNPHSYAIAQDDLQFGSALRAADWLIPDGIGIVYASRFLRGQIRERVTGSDVFAGLHDRLSVHGGLSVFFLGSTEDTLAAIRARMAREFPAIRVAGTYSPPFKASYTETELVEMIEAVNSARPDVLWVGMTAPKQEKWIAANLARLDVRFTGAIGAVFDFYAGSVQRSHPLFQKFGLEWLPRLMQQPRRLWRRMLISAPIFTWHVIQQVVTQRRR